MASPTSRLAAGAACAVRQHPDLLDHLRATFNPESTVSYDERFDQVRNSPLLILDDLGTQSNSEWAQETIRFSTSATTPNYHTVITTNLDLESI